MQLSDHLTSYQAYALARYKTEFKVDVDPAHAQDKNDIIQKLISRNHLTDMIAPLLTFALQAATYQAGIPTHNYNKAKECQKSTIKLSHFLMHFHTLILLSKPA